jgi:hypothetical protein
VFRTDVLCRLLVERLCSLGPMTEAAALEAVEWRAPGRGHETLRWAQQRGLIRRVRHDAGPMLEAAGAPLRSHSRV